MKYLQIFLLLLLCSCNTELSYVEDFKQEQIKYDFVDTGITYEDFFSQLASVEGKVAYKCFSSEKIENPDVKCIDVKISKPESSKCAYKTANIQFLYNTNTKAIETRYTSFNGKPTNVLASSVKMQVMLVNSEESVDYVDDMF